MICQLKQLQTPLIYHKIKFVIYLHSPTLHEVQHILLSSFVYLNYLSSFLLKKSTFAFFNLHERFKKHENFIILTM